MTDLVPVFKGSVNRWECDENDHLNVRFYAHKMYQTVQAGLLDAGLVSHDELGAVSRRILSAHMRYIAEARLAAPMTGFFGIVEQDSTTVRAVTELRHSTTSALMASYVFDLELTATTSTTTVDLPEGAGSRGLPMARSRYAMLDLDQAAGMGFMPIGQGVIQAEECDGAGDLLFYQYIGRISDAIPNLWASLAGASSRGEGLLGGAVLEYRTDKMATLRLDNPFVVMSGFSGLAEKTKHLVHLMFHAGTGECVTASEAIAVNMDLVARKAVPIPPAEREAMSQLLIREV